MGLSLKKSGVKDMSELQVLAPKNEVAPPLDNRALRRDALMKMRDLWNSAGTKSVDGVEYQKAMRSEWR
jgi:hypothetical protein